MLSVTYAECHLCLMSLMLSVIYAECHYAQCHYDECRGIPGANALDYLGFVGAREEKVLKY